MTHILPAAVPAFLASLVEFVEALTIVLAVAITRGAKPAWIGSVAGAALLAGLVIALGPLLGRVPLEALQLVVGTLLLFFGMRWLRKAILRYAGIVALHDESRIFAQEKAALESGPRVSAGLDWAGVATAFNAVVLEGLEVVFIVVAVGAAAGALAAAALGAAVAGVVVVGAGVALHRPLARIPENALKFAVGIMLSAFGTFWTGEGLGFAWPGADASLAWLVVSFAVVGAAGVQLARSARGAAAH